MILEIKLYKIGQSLGLLLPAEALARLNVKQGDTLFLTETPERGYCLTAGNPEFGSKLKAAQSLSCPYRNAIGELMNA